MMAEEKVHLALLQEGHSLEKSLADWGVEGLMGQKGKVGLAQAVSLYFYNMSTSAPCH